MDDLEKTLKWIKEKKYILIAEIAPSLKAVLGEIFNCKEKIGVEKRLICALKQAGFKYVFDTSAGADIVTIEEGTELINRLEKGKNLPLFTSCCIESFLFIEKKYPKLLKHFCTVKSPQQTIGALAKTFFAEKIRQPKRKIKVISIMPCPVKKIEAKRKENKINGNREVDAVLTALELPLLFEKTRVKFKKAKKKEFDYFLGKASGGGKIFGESGGVAEALLRFLIKKNPKKRILSKRDYFKEIEVDVGYRKIKILLLQGIENIEKCIEKKEYKKYDVIEMMACKGGCIGGAGLPKTDKKGLEKRRKILNKIDRKEKIKRADKNKEIIEIYKKYLKYPLSKESKRILHLKN